MVTKADLNYTPVIVLASEGKKKKLLRLCVNLTDPAQSYYEVEYDKCTDRYQTFDDAVEAYHEA